MTASSIPSAIFLGFLAAALFLTMTVGLMVGPLLVDLATAFHTSVAVTGQLTTATALTWALTAFLAGPVSDTYSRRRMLLFGLLMMVLGTLSAAVAWTYGALVICRCLTGVGAAMIAPNCLATVADLFPPAQRGTAMGRGRDMPGALARIDASGSTPVIAVLVVGVAIAALVLLGNVKTTWSFSAFTVLIYYAITNLAALRLPGEARLFPRWVAWAGLAACLFLAFWVETRIWLVGLAMIGVGLLWHAVARRIAASSQARRL